MTSPDSSSLLYGPPGSLEPRRAKEGGERGRQSSAHWLLYGDAPDGSMSGAKVRLEQIYSALGNFDPWRRFVGDADYGIPAALIRVRAAEITLPEAERMHAISEDPEFGSRRVKAWDIGNRAARSTDRWKEWEALQDSIHRAVDFKAAPASEDRESSAWDGALTGAQSAALAILTRSALRPEPYRDLTHLWREVIGFELLA